MSEDKDSDRWLDEIIEAWPRLTWLQQKHIFLMCFYYVQRNRFESWLHGVMYA